MANKTYYEFFDSVHRRRQTWKELNAGGIGTDNLDFLATLKIYPFEEYRPEYDASTHELKPEMIDHNGESVPNYVLRDGIVYLPYVATPLPQAMIIQNLYKKYELEIDTRLTKLATDRGYASLDALAKYTNVTTEPFRSEAIWLTNFVATVYAEAYKVMNKVLSGEMQMPTMEGLFSLLPPIEWPADLPPGIPQFMTMHNS